MSDPIIAWWSAGVTSAVACKLALDKYGRDNVRVVYIHIDTAHEDNERFMKECEEWYGKEIEVIKNSKFNDQFDCIEHFRWINGPSGARCSMELKKAVRIKFQEENPFSGQIFGFEYSKKEVNRALRFLDQFPETNPIFPLIDAKMSKDVCMHYLVEAGIKPPKMYELGYPNNNCIGCVKGGAGYWNKIREDFPEVFEKMIETEEIVGAACMKDKNGPLYLKDLAPNRGYKLAVVVPDCGEFCDVKFEDIPHKKLEEEYGD